MYWYGRWKLSRPNSDDERGRLRFQTPFIDGFINAFG